MTEIVLHVGMPKTGSTSIQNWLARDARGLAKSQSVIPMTATASTPTNVSVQRYTSGTMNSIGVMQQCLKHPERRAQVLDQFFDELGRACDEHDGTLALSSNPWGRAIALREDDFVDRLDELGRNHEVVVAYYVRPQHDFLLSGWRHWRSTRETTPSAYIERLERELHHLHTVQYMRERAPHVEFRLRPCRRDLLHGGSVVVDFAHEFLGITATSDARDNQGIPLDVTNALTSIPSDLRWTPDQDEVVVRTVKHLLSDVDTETSERAQLSRLVLQQACHDRFEPENLELIELLGWDTHDWVPAVTQDIGPASFDRLDDLWQTDASPAELELIHAALATIAVDRSHRNEANDLRRQLDDLRNQRTVRAALAISNLHQRLRRLRHR